MQRLLAGAAPRHAFLLRKGPAWDDPAQQHLQWEHARNMFTLLRDHHLSYVCPLMDGTDVVGFGVIDASSREAAARLLEHDPGVRAGRLRFEVLQGVPFGAGEVRI
jgi:hypothetical protein